MALTLVIGRSTISTWALTLFNCSACVDDPTSGRKGHKFQSTGKQELNSP